jgi:hypothetical protein
MLQDWWPCGACGFIVHPMNLKKPNESHYEAGGAIKISIEHLAELVFFVFSLLKKHHIFVLIPH